MKKKPAPIMLLAPKHSRESLSLDVAEIVGLLRVSIRHYGLKKEL